ncbi:MAG: DUF3108 domain-containing protein [Rhodanobacteraceae bacterium]
MNALRFSRFVIVFAALLFAGSPLAAPLPAFTARYQLLQNGELIGEATMTLAPSGDDEWTFTTQSRGTSGMAALLGANVRETSRFHWKAALPEGLSYDYSLDAAIKHKERHVRFDWASNTISVDDKGEQRFAAQPGTIERHTLVLAIAVGLDAGQRAFAFPVAVRDRIETQHFAVQGKGTIKVPEGSYAATHVARTDGGGFDAWFAPGKLPVPVQVSQHDNGDLTMKLESYTAGARAE